MIRTKENRKYLKNFKGCCPICMQSIINSGVYELVTPNLDFEHISCGEHYQYSLDMAKESGIIWNFDDRLQLGGF